MRSRAIISTVVSEVFDYGADTHLAGGLLKAYEGTTIEEFETTH